MLDGSIACLWTHRTFKTAHSKARLLQPKSDEVEEIDKLAEDDALRRRVLLAEIAELFNEGLDLCRRAPLVEVKAA